MDETERQWIDLGIQDVCLAQPDFGSEGGTLSVWLKVAMGSNTGTLTGIISSRKNPQFFGGFTLGRIGSMIT